MYDSVIKTFITVIELGSFSKAADALYLSRVSVMKQINGLESRLGFKLIERRSTGIIPTKAGLSYYNDAVDIIRRSEEAETRARQLSGTGKTIIRIGASLLHPPDYLIRLWETECLVYPQIKLEIVPFYDRNLTDELGVRFDAIIGVNDSHSWEGKFGFLEISRKTIACAMPKNHPYASRLQLEMNDFANQTVLMVPPGDSPVNTMLRGDLLTQCPGINILNAPYLYNVDVFNRCIEENCLLLSFDYWKNVHPMLKTIPVRWNYKVPYGVIYPIDPSPGVQLFLDAIKLSMQRG